MSAFKHQRLYNPPIIIAVRNGLAPILAIWHQDISQTNADFVLYAHRLQTTDHFSGQILTL